MNEESVLPVYKTWKAIEIVLLLMCVADAIIAHQLRGGTFGAYSLPLTVSLVLVGVLLNLFQPFKAKYWLQLTIPLCEIAVTAGLLVFGGVRYVGVLYPAIIAKSSTHLDKKGSALLTVMALFAHFYSMWARFHGHSEVVTHWDLTGFNLPLFILSRSGGIVAAILFSAWLSLSLVKERETRMRAEQLAQQVEVFARKLERSRIARDIHDTLGHTLTSLNIQLDIARMPGRDVPHDLLKVIDVAKQLAEQSFDDLKSAIHMLRGSDLDLKKALESLSAKFARESNMTIKVDVRLPMLQPDITSHIYLLALEIITNARKHAEASELFISLQSDNGNVVLIGKDNGKGFDAGSDSTGFGLKGMRERVSSMNGSLEILTEPGRHTTVKATIPLTAANSAAA